MVTKAADEKLIISIPYCLLEQEFKKEDYCSNQDTPVTDASSGIGPYNGFDSNKSVQHHCQDQDEGFVNEIPGGFSEIDSIDQSSTFDDSNSCYINYPKLDVHIGMDWEDIEVSSDIEENNIFRERGYHNCLHECYECGKKFTNVIELNGHELIHQQVEMYRCHVHHCDSKYKKESQLKSHMKKRHPEYWTQVSQILDSPNHLLSS